MIAKIRNSSFEVDSHGADFWGWVEEGRYDREWTILDMYLKPEHTFLDLGAWIGSHSLYASRKAKRVVAVEPDPVAYEILKKNLSCASCPAQVYKVAVGEQGLVQLGSGLLGASTTRKNHSGGGGIGPVDPAQCFWAESVTIRQLVDKMKIEDPLFIKMDVEGSEEDILEDVDFFAEHKPVLYLETHPWWWRSEFYTRQAIDLVSKVCTLIQ